MNSSTANALPIESLGSRIRDLRHARGKTLAQISSETGLSRGFLSQVENGLTRMSLSALYRIAAALATTAPELLMEGQQPVVSVVRRDEGEWLPAAEADTGQLARSLLSAPRSEIEARECVIPSGFRSDPPWVHAGEEFLFVLEGRMAVEVAGHGTFELDEGDAMVFDAQIEHRWIGFDRQARVLNVISLPTGFRPENSHGQSMNFRTY